MDLLLQLDGEVLVLLSQFKYSSKLPHTAALAPPRKPSTMTSGVGLRERQGRSVFSGTVKPAAKDIL